MKYHFEKKNGFTLAEVLITLGVIGVVAAFTLPSVISKYQNQVYLAGLKKLSSTVQNAHSGVVAELGEPNIWNFVDYHTDKDNTKSDIIAQEYSKHVSGKYCGRATFSLYTPQKCINLNYDQNYRVLNGDNWQGNTWYHNSGLYYYTYQYRLSDGTTFAILFGNNVSGAVFWTLLDKGIKIIYILDVNGDKKPNQVGRDIYYFMLKDNKLQPYYNGISDCKKGDLGFTCAYDVITNGWEFPKDYPY